MEDKKVKPANLNKRLRDLFRGDSLLFVFLFGGWLLIFLFATLGLQRDNQIWLPINPVVRAAADYSVDENPLQLAQVKPEIIDAVRQDAENREALKTPTPLTELLELPTPTPTPSATATVRSPLTVDVGGPYEGEEGSEIAFKAGNFNSGLNILPGGVTYEWDLDGDGVYDDAEGLTASFIFYDEGDYPISVRASDLLGRTAFDTTVANVLNVDPLVQIGNNMYTSESRPVYFSATASDPGRDVLFYEWDFGDGSSDGGNNTLRPEHTFGDDGEYRVILRVKDNDGGLSEDRLTVYVGNLPPEITPLTDQTVDEGSPLTLKGQASDPAKGNDTLSYAWDFDFDGNNFSPDADGETVTTTYPDGPADMIAALQVKDEDGGETIETLDVTVNNVRPVITRISDSGPVGEGSFLDIVVSASDVGNDTLSYGFDWNNDGSYDTVQSSGSASHVWTNQGRHTVRIRVDDGDGGQVFSSTVVSTFNLTPTAIAQIPNSTYFEGSPVPFDASESSDPGDDVLTYAWDFGDQTTGSGINPTHTYADNGAYNVTLTVTDDSGAADQDIIPVLILNANPTVNAGPDREIDEGDDVSVTFTGSGASDPGPADLGTLTYAWDFDFDGTFVSEATGLSTNFVYPLLDGPRDIIVALRVRDDDYPAPIDNGGQIGEYIDTFMLTVKNLPPTNVDAGGDYDAIVSKPITLTAAVANDISADPLTYAWDFDYDGSGSFATDVRGRVVTHTWTSFGLKTVGLRVSDGDGGQVFDTARVDVNSIPTADAGGPYSGDEGSPIVFDGRGSSDLDGDTLRYRWNFGDGTPNQTGITTTHVFSDNGTYITTLTVRDAHDALVTDVVTATVYNLNPVIPAIANQTATEGVAFNFRSLTNPVYDPGALDTLTYFWDFDYDGTNFDNDATGRNVSRIFPDGPATFTVALWVQDDEYPYNTANGGEIGRAVRPFQLTVQNAPPIANAGGPNYNGVEGQPITLSGSVTDTGRIDTHTYAWDLDNNGTYETPGQTINHTWPVGGVYPVALRVTDKDGAAGTATAMVTVNYNPRADAGGPYTGREGIPVTLDGSGSFDPDNTNLTYSWDFGDGSPPGTTAVVNHVYLDNGDYVATLTVTDGQGGRGTDQADVAIANVPPTAVVGGPYSGNEGQAITMDGRGSFDPSPGDDATLTYSWNFGDGSPPPASADRVTHTYADNGVYNVSLTVTDKDGGTSSISTTATVNNVNPTASAGGPYRTTINLPVNLNGSGTDVAADTLTFAWDLDNDGTFETPGQNVVNSWATPGVKTIRLRVTDDDGGSATSTTTVDVGSPPIAVAGGPYNGSENIAITLDGSGSSDPDGDPITYRWTFGDGSPAATGAVVNHTYVDNGAYVATLTVTDNRGGVTTAQANVTITNAAPTANISGPTSGNEGQDITFDGRGSSDPGPNDTLSYNWVFSDGGTASGPTASHQYRDNGTFTVTLTVTDKDGASDSTSMTITINNVAPTANAGGPYGGDDEAPAGVTILFDGSGSSDPGPDDTLTYQWTFGDGSPPDTDPVVSHTYLDSGSYTVRLTVTDDDGATNTATILVVINNLPPTADAGGPYDTTVDVPVELTGNGSDIPADLPLTYEWDLDNNGTFETAGQTVDFTQSTTGTYTIVLQVSDDDGGSTTASTTIQVNSLLPLAWLTLPFILTRLRKRKR